MSLLDRARARRLRTLLLSLLAPLVLALVPAGPAAAHPFGDPQTLEVSTDGDQVRLRWKVGGTDDLTALALHLGLLPPERVMLDGATIYEDGDGELLAASPAFSDYLLDRVRVTVRDRGCVGDVVPTADPATDGVLLSFDCRTSLDAGTEAAVEARLLTDLHPDYRTLAEGPGGQRAVYDDENPEHTWAVGAVGSVRGGATARSAVLQLGSVLCVAAAGGVAAAFYVRRRGRRVATAA